MSRRRTRIWIWLILVYQIVSSWVNAAVVLAVYRNVSVSAVSPCIPLISNDPGICCVTNEQYSMVVKSIVFNNTWKNSWLVEIPVVISPNVNCHWSILNGSFKWINISINNLHIWRKDSAWFWLAINYRGLASLKRRSIGVAHIRDKSFFQFYVV